MIAMKRVHVGIVHATSVKNMVSIRVSTHQATNALNVAWNGVKIWNRYQIT